MKAFSGAARAELARTQPRGQCCAHAELGGIIRASGSLCLLGNGRFSLSVQTEHADVARKAVTLLRAVTGLPSEVAVETQGRLRRTRLYHVTVGAKPRDPETPHGARTP